jgi:GTP-binding protein
MSVDFIQTLADPKQLPDLIRGEYLQGRRESRLILVGRSNVGKSSLINTMLGTKLAQVSANPGKTRAIHFYYWREGKRIVADLPGYGFANASKGDKTQWAKLIDAYLKADVNIERALVLLDSRHGPTDKDLEAIEFLKGIPLLFIFTKSDQLKTQKLRAQRHKEASLALSDLGYNPKEAYWVSVHDRDGIRKLAAAVTQETT